MVLLCFWAVAAAGCSAQPTTEQPTASVAFGKIERDDFRSLPVDVLVVMDNSGSMAYEQGVIGRDFPAFIRDILNPPPAEDGSQLFSPVRDLHVGVVSTDLGVGGYNVQTCVDDPLVGDNGVLQHEPSGAGCDPFYPDFLSYAIEEGEAPVLAAIEKMGQDFACISNLGTDGCGFEQQLEVSYRALMVQSQPGGTNGGFLRPEAILALVFVTDEEDCSAEDTSVFDLSDPYCDCGMGCYFRQELLFLPSRYAAMLESLKPGQDWVALAVVAGVPSGDPVCNGRGDQIAECLDAPLMQYTLRPDATGIEFVCKYPADCQPPDPPYSGDCMSDSFPGRRLVELAQVLGPNATVGSICAENYEPVLLDLAAMVREKHQRLGHNAQPRVTKTDCVCRIECTVTESLPEGSHTCDPGKNLRVDVSGVTMCDIPQVGARLSDCSLDCLDPDAAFVPDQGEGWLYDPNAPEGPTVEFVGLVPAEGATLMMECE